jgi:Arc/MetJ-type ribon-helix-helix transcriptional regulator
MVTVDFEKRKSVSFRVKNDIGSKIENVLKNNQDVYANLSHFVRSSVIRNLKRYDQEGNEIRPVKIEKADLIKSMEDKEK